MEIEGTYIDAVYSMKNKMFGPFPVFELQNSEIKCSRLK